MRSSLVRAVLCGGVTLGLLALAGPASAQVNVRIGESMAVQARNVEITLNGTVEVEGTLDTRGSTVTFTNPDDGGGISLGKTFTVELTEVQDFEGSSISGPVQLGGTLEVQVAPNTDIEEGDAFVILSCSAGCTGTFETVHAPFAVDVVYETNAVTVEALEAISTSVEERPADESPGTIAEQFTLQAPYPNPFSTTTTFRLDVPVTTEVRVEAFDFLGRRVALLSEGRFAAGSYDVRWMAAGLPSGVYVVRAQMEEGSVAVQQVTLVR